MREHRDMLLIQLPPHILDGFLHPALPTTEVDSGGHQMHHDVAPAVPYAFYDASGMAESVYLQSHRSPRDFTYS